MTNRTIVGIKRTIVGILRPVIGEAALTRLSITWRRAVSGPRPLPVPIEEPSAGTAVAAAVTAKPAKPGKKSLNAAFGLARTMPGFLTPDDLESLYDLGRGGGTVCWIGNSDEDSQAAAMLYAGGADLVVSGPPDSNTGDFNAGGAKRTPSFRIRYRLPSARPGHASSALTVSRRGGPRWLICTPGWPTASGCGS
jgi:hypothetical protein